MFLDLCSKSECIDATSPPGFRRIHRRYLVSILLKSVLFGSMPISFLISSECYGLLHYCEPFLAYAPFMIFGHIPSFSGGSYLICWQHHDNKWQRLSVWHQLLFFSFSICHKIIIKIFSVLQPINLYPFFYVSQPPHAFYKLHQDVFLSFLPIFPAFSLFLPC